MNLLIQLMRYGEVAAVETARLARSKRCNRLVFLHHYRRRGGLR